MTDAASTVDSDTKETTSHPLYLADLPAKFGHVPSLDGLRAISVGLVVFAHLVNDRLFPGGLGVLIFFVISGFLITRLMIAEVKHNGGLNVPKFYLRRVFRLYPAVLVFSLAVSAAFLAATPSHFDIQEPLSALFYYANYLFAWREFHGLKPTMPFSQFWSLSVEEQYYLVFPMLFLWSQARPTRLLSIAGVACVAPVALRFVYAVIWPQILGQNHHFIYFHTETRIDSIAFGVLIAALCEFPSGQRVIGWLATPLPVVIAIGTTLLCLAFRNPFFRETIRYTLLNASAVTMLCTLVFSERYRFGNLLLNSTAFVWIGRLSYSIYVWHEATAGAVNNLFPRMSRVPLTIIALGAVLAVSAASYYGPERAAREWRKRLHLR